MASTGYVVRRISWDSDSDRDGIFRRCGYESAAAGVPVRVFADRVAAEAFRLEREMEARTAVTPGRMTGWWLPKQAQPVIDELRRLGLEPPTLDDDFRYSDVLLKWWHDVAGSATSDQRAGFWEVLGVQFYDVVAVPLED